MSKLKPCPFCGAHPLRLGTPRGTEYAVVTHFEGCFFLADGLPVAQQHIPREEYDAWNGRTG